MGHSRLRTVLDSVLNGLILYDRRVSLFPHLVKREQLKVGS